MLLDVALRPVGRAAPRPVEDFVGPPFPQPTTGDCHADIHHRTRDPGRRTTLEGRTAADLAEVRRRARPPRAVRRSNGCKATSPATRSIASTSRPTRKPSASTRGKADSRRTACPRSRRSDDESIRRRRPGHRNEGRAAIGGWMDRERIGSAASIGSASDVTAAGVEVGVASGSNRFCKPSSGGRRPGHRLRSGPKPARRHRPAGADAPRRGSRPATRLARVVPPIGWSARVERAGDTLLPRATGGAPRGPLGSSAAPVACFLLNCFGR